MIDLRNVIMMLKSIKKFSEQRKSENSRQKNIFQHFFELQKIACSMPRENDLYTNMAR